MRKTNDNGIELVKHYEGLRLEAYRCPSAVWTIGYGSTRGVRQGMRITEAEADKRLRQDLTFAEVFVGRLVEVELTDDQFAALVSFTFNVGGGAFSRSTLLRKLNAGDYYGASKEFGRWNKAGGRVLSGLTARRESERRLFVGDGLSLG